MDQPTAIPATEHDALLAAARDLARIFEAADPQMPIECWNAVWLLSEAAAINPKNLKATAAGVAYEFQQADPQRPIECWNAVWDLANLVVPHSAPPFASW
jgi:hypothetical protein